MLILDGKSVDNLPLRDTTVKLRDEGVGIHVRMTWEKGNAQRYVDEAHQLDVVMMIAGDDDGTINEVSTALIQSQDGNIPTLGILPLRTANDFATNVGIPDDLDEALKLVIATNVTAVDVVQVDDKTCFINMATGGSGARITIETPEELKAALGGVSYFIHGLMHMNTFKPDICDIRGEDFHWQGKALVTDIGSSRQAGGGRQLYPTALINDSLLQLRIFIDEGLLPGLLSALTQSEDNPNIIKGASSWFDTHAPYGITFNLNGEPPSGQEFHIEILPAALRCRLPPDYPLLR